MGPREVNEGAHGKDTEASVRSRGAGGRSLWEERAPALRATALPCDVMGGAGSKRSCLSDEAERMKVRETTIGCFAGVRGDCFKNARCVG